MNALINLISTIGQARLTTALLVAAALAVGAVVWLG
jgi:hypothetical protein